jgi:acetoin utilization deacetylase AcuC-like enzyme
LFNIEKIMAKVKVVFSERQISDTGVQPTLFEGFTASPSANKPKQMYDALRNAVIPGLEIEFVEPEPVSIDDLKLVHDSALVEDVMSLRRTNGFGTISQSVVDSLPFTNGAQYTAAKLATAEVPTCALVSGFHHAGYAGWERLGLFCTFNGLMVTAAKLLEEGKKRIAIVDCDQHWGNGTDDILKHLPKLASLVTHLTFGKYFSKPNHADRYLSWMEEDGILERSLLTPDVVIYQAGADVHVNDPYGGVLTTEQMYERDLRMFRIAKRLQLPLTWNLAGGYQVGPNGEIDKVLELHLNTFRAMAEVYA